ncbi:MAG TPA: YggT family protein [Anaerolineales bacterium]|nr:YggT family protein [Anaerolineales bacterium]
MAAGLAQAISFLTTLLIILIIVWVVVSWVLPPYHPLREALDRIMDPMLAPIRRVMPATGSIDFSPMILIVLIELISRVVTSLLYSLR